MSFQNNFPVESPILTGSPSPQPDFDSCLFCYVNIIPNVSPFVEEGEAVLKRAHLLKNLLYHLGYSMAFLPEECQRSNIPICCCCVDKLHKMWFHFYEAMKIACGMRDTVVECVAAGKRYAPKQENGNLTKMREVIVHGALYNSRVPANSEPQRFLQQVKKIVDYEALGSGNSAPGTNAHTGNEESPIEVAARALGISMPILLFPASSSSSSTNVDQVAASVPRPPLSLNVPVASNSGLRNRNTFPETTSCQRRPSSFNYIECNKCQAICFTQRGFDKHLTECQPSRTTTNEEQHITTTTRNESSQPNAGTRQPKENGQQSPSTSSQFSILAEHHHLGGPRPLRFKCFKCRICNTWYKTKESCRIHELNFHQFLANKRTSMASGRAFKCIKCNRAYDSTIARRRHERLYHKIFLRTPRKMTCSVNQLLAPTQIPSRLPTTNEAQIAVAANTTRNELMQSSADSSQCIQNGKPNEQQRTSPQSVEDQSICSWYPSSGRFKCSICARSFTTKDNCRKHEQKFHKLLRPNPVAKDRSYKCSRCKRVYGSVISRRNHERNYHQIILRPPRKRTSSVNQLMTPTGVSCHFEETTGVSSDTGQDQQNDQGTSRNELTQPNAESIQLIQNPQENGQQNTSVQSNTPAKCKSTSK